MQVHADASNFAAGVTKEAAYLQVLEQAEGLFINQRNWVSPLGNRIPHSSPPPFIIFYFSDIY